MTLRRYTPTDSGWLVFSANDALLLVVKPNDLSVVEQLWHAVRGGAQATLDELTRSGFSAAPSFALIEWNPAAEGASAPLRAIVRGEVVVTVSTAGGARRLDGAEASTWSEQLIDGASAFDLSTGAEPAETTLPFIAGVVKASRVSAGTVTAPVTSAVADVSIASVVPADAAAATATPEPAAVAAPVDAPSPAEVAAELIASMAAPATTPAAVAEPAAPVAAKVSEAKKAAPKKAAPKASPSAGPDLGDTRVVESTVVAGANLESQALTDEEDSEGDGYDYLFGATVHRGVSDAAMSEAPAEEETPAPSAAGDHDGHTIMSGDLRKLRGSRKTALPGSAAPAASVPILVLSTGGREPLTQPIIVGRAPAAAKVSGDQLPRLVTIPGDQDISRSHVRFALEGDTVVVTDLHSRNGTLIVMPGASPQQLRQGEPTAVIVGTVIDLGGGVTLTVHEDN